MRDRNRPTTRNTRLAKLAAFALFAGGVVTFTFAESNANSPVGQLVKLGIKFDGAKTCAAAACHGGTEPGEPPHGQNAYTKWSGADPHRAAFDTLTKDESKKMATALGIADPTKADDCLSCHATNVPDAMQGKDFAVDEGNSCTTCHGPSDKYLTPHAAKGWTEQQRKANGAPAFGYEAKLLASTGIYDTKSLVFRAERCTSCHLAIDHKLIKAGHPVTYFEMDYFSNPNVYQDRHWRDGSEPYFNTHQWAAGQIVSARDSFRQLASRAAGGDDEAVKQAFEQAMSHGHALKALGGPAAPVVAKLDAVKLGDKAALATAATAVATAAEAAFPAFSSYKPSKADTVKALSALAADAQLTGLGIHGVEQQALGIFALYNALVTTDKIAEAEATGVNDSIAKLFGPLDPATKGKMDGYADALKEVAGKLPK